MTWGIALAERARTLAAAKKRERERRWSAPGQSRVIHPTYGTVVVPHASNLAAIQNAAEVWRCDWAEITDAQVWAAEPGDVPVKMPYIICALFPNQFSCASLCGKSTAGGHPLTAPSQGLIL